MLPSPRLIGHSHSQQVFAAAAAAGFSLEGYNFWSAPQPAITADRLEFHPEIASCLAEGTVFSMVGGAVHNIMGLVQHPEPFDFVLPADPDLPIDKSATHLPVAAIESAMMRQLQEYLDIIGLVRQVATGRVFHFEPPPPFKDNARLVADVPWAFFPDLTTQVSPPSLRYKFWRLASQLVRDYCMSHDVEFVQIPLSVIDRDGYLRPEYYGDAMHVNQAYGHLVLDQIRALA